MESLESLVSYEMGSRKVLLLPVAKIITTMLMRCMNAKNATITMLVSELSISPKKPQGQGVIMDTTDIEGIEIEHPKTTPL